MEKDLISWFRDMILPYPEVGFVHVSEGHDWSQHGEGELYGIVLESNSQHDIEEAYRVLKPGGHLFLVAPEDEPTGHTGACIAEDVGFRVRDSILMVESSSKLVYSGKTTTREREAGCHDMEEKNFGMSGGANSSIERGEDNYESAQSIGLDRVSKRRNVHPTVKSRAVMEFLLSDIETGRGVIMDPFMGSGTTGMACLRTGHDFIGIEKEEEYARIADSRIRHWVLEEEPWNETRIESEVVRMVKEEVKEVSIMDLLGVMK